MLDERQYIVRHVLTKDGYMLNLFFTYNEAAHQVAIYPEVPIVNATYKTNIYKLSLINAVGVSNVGDSKALNTYTIAIAWVFISDRALALRKAADKVFSEAKKIICIWHMLAQNLQTAFAYAEKMNEVKKAFNEVNKAAMKSKDPKYIQTYFEKWKNNAESEGSHSALKKAIKAASGLKQVFLHIDCAFRQCQLRTNGTFGLNIISADPFIRNNMRFELLLEKISKWAIDKIKNKVCKIGENKNTDNSPCDCSLRLNYKLPCRHIIPQTGPIPLALIEVLASEEIVIPKAPLPNAPKKKHPTSTKRDPLLSDVIANTYQRPLYFFSLQISLTFLPYHHPLNQNEALAMAFVNENHYVALVLRPGTPVPPIVNRWS
ncbi:19153_t:CDS:2 [Dentiscutata erythropus]|uniref:19153_t:CDS:1 n=1 Tax=Dentiscutata erythropus TaxID=1348616 RepID=A0A9N9A9H2_9GLOM|nr:19153_t:CDS:2 [Dentiscutata erythropus]